MKIILNNSQYNFYKTHIKEDRTLTQNQNKLIKIVNLLQKGYMSFDDLENFVGGFDILIRKLSDEGLLNYINPFDPMWEDYQNYLFYIFYENDSNFVWKLVDRYLSDVIEENGKYYMKVDPDDLSSFFNDSYRSEISRDGIESIISGEYDYDISYDVTDNEYRDVYKELNNENKKVINQIIKNNLLTVGEMDVNTRTPSSFDDIAKEQGHDDYIKLTHEIIDRLLDDENCVEYIIMEESDDLKHDLYNLYHGCYNTNLQDSWYDSIMNELEGNVIDDSKRINYTYEKKVYDKEGNPIMKKMYGDKYEATNCIYNAVSEWLSENKDDQRTILDYHGSYRELLHNLIYVGSRDLLNIPRLDDYPSHRDVIRCINENFGGYF